MTESSLLSLFQTNTTPKHSEHTFECDGYKECPGCSETKPHSEFGIRDKSKGTIRSRCKSCHTKYLLEWRHKNPDKVKPAVRRSALKFKYGMSVRDYDQRLIEQGGVCRICGLSCDTGNRLAVDH